MDSELNFCRICLKTDTSKNFISIFPNKSELATQINQISAVKVKLKIVYFK